MAICSNNVLRRSQGGKFCGFSCPNKFVLALETPRDDIYTHIYNYANIKKLITSWPREDRIKPVICLCRSLPVNKNVKFMRIDLVCNLNVNVECISTHIVFF